MKKKVEFDEFAKNYRAEQDKHLSLTGDDSEYFARYKVHQLATWNPNLLSKANNILDFGCGDGLMSSYLAYYFNNSKVFGTDISEESVDIAKANYKNINFSMIAENHIDFPDNFFDIVCSAGVFHHIKHTEHHIWIAELMRVLKPGGICVIFEPNPLNPGTQYIFWNHPMEENAQMLWPWYTKKFLNPFGTIDMKFFSYFPGWLKKLRFLEPWLERVPFGGLYAAMLTKNTT